jgi:hypothetical protein
MISHQALTCVSGVGLTTDDASIELLEQLHSRLLGCIDSLSTADEGVLLE